VPTDHGSFQRFPSIGAGQAPAPLGIRWPVHKKHCGMSQTDGGRVTIGVWEPAASPAPAFSIGMLCPSHRRPRLWELPGCREEARTCPNIIWQIRWENRQGAQANCKLKVIRLALVPTCGAASETLRTARPTWSPSPPADRAWHFHFFNALFSTAATATTQTQTVPQMGGC
jgi:hypothetical protein